DNVYMSVNVSVRLDDALAERRRMRARAAGESLSDRLRRYAEEGARRDEHPLITFRDGPTGRRAGLVGGPDVWEVSMWVEDLAAGQHHPGVLIASSSRFSRRPAGRGALVAAVLAAATEPLEDRVVYLQPADRE